MRPVPQRPAVGAPQSLHYLTAVHIVSSAQLRPTTAAPVLAAAGRLLHQPFAQTEQGGGAGPGPACVSARGVEAFAAPTCSAYAPQTTRRHLMQLSLAVALHPPAAPAAAAPAAAPALPEPPSSFYLTWPYLEPRDILPFLRARARRGDAEAVLRAIDEFAGFYPMFRSGPEKGMLLEAQVRAAAPALALEIGTFMGYGAIRIARQLPPGGRLVSLEADEQQAEVARAVLDLAGLADKVQVVQGLASASLPAVAAELAAAGGERRAGLVWLDHCKDCYLPDLQLMERLGLVGPGTVVMADNVIVPGAPGYLEYVMPPGAEAGGAEQGGGAHSDAAPVGVCRWRTRLVEAAFEVEGYSGEWKAQKDAVAVSVCGAVE